MRLLAVIVALALLLGEPYRGIIGGRPALFWLDDVAAAALLLAAATAHPRPLLRAGAWGVAAAVLYANAADKLAALGPAATRGETLLVGFLAIGFVVGVAGFWRSVRPATGDHTASSTGQSV